MAGVFLSYARDDTPKARQVAAATEEQAKSVTILVQSNVQVRKTSQEVKKAMAEQARAARDILKAAQSTREQSSQVRKATQQQAKTATEIARAAESMRRGAANTMRALAEQSVASEEIAKAAGELHRQIAWLRTRGQRLTRVIQRSKKRGSRRHSTTPTRWTTSAAPSAQIDRKIRNNSVAMTALAMK